MTSTLEREETVTDKQLDELEKLATQVPEDTRRGLAIASFADTEYAVSHGWAPARHREDFPEDHDKVEDESLSSYSL